MTIWSPNVSPDVEPKYQALLVALQADIEAGLLAPGAPTQRELASRLGIAIGTVSRAYALGACPWTTRA